MKIFRLLKSLFSFPDYYFAGTNHNRIFILRFLNEQWKVDDESLSLEGRILSMSENPNGSLWITTRYDGIYKIEWSSLRRSFDKKNYTSAHYDTLSGLPEMNYNVVFKVNDEVYFSTVTGIFRFDGKSKRFIYSSPIMNQLNNSTTSFDNSIEASFDGGMWIVQKSNFQNTIYKLKENKLDEISELKGFSNFEVYDIYDKNNIIFFGGPKGIIAYDHKSKRKYDTPLTVNLRKVIVGNDSLLFAGHASLSKKIKLSFNNNSFRFEYALPSYDKPDAN